MDYWPNIEAVEWFAREAMPLTANWNSPPEFWIVGAKPAPMVRRLARLPRVHVTGWVQDVRPYLAHAAAVVAPLHIAPGIQNKVLEAMAMAKPVIATAEAASGILEVSDREIVIAADAADFARGIERATTDEGTRLGRNARTLVESRFRWQQSWAVLDRLFEGSGHAETGACSMQTDRGTDLPRSAVGG
jgi:glycosyltransferase involved in cell wall biosynthesis